MIFKKHLSALRTAAAAALLSFTLTLPAQTPAPLITNTGMVNDLPVEDSNISLEAYDARGQVFPLNTEFIVELDSPVELSKTRGLVLYFGRYDNTGAPTVVEVSGYNQGLDKYDVLGYAYLLFRGGGRTHEFSNRVYGNGAYNSFKFKILEVSSGTQAQFYKFNIFAIGNNENYPAGRADELRAAGDYYLGYWNYKYQPNNGILSHRNHYGDNEIYCMNEGDPDAVMSAPWGDESEFEYDGETHHLPTFDQQDGSQMPHVTQLTVYAMPGDVIPLIPFYDLPSVDNYREKFSHWYGYIPRDSVGNLQKQTYSNDLVKDSVGNVLLDFLVDPASIIKTEKYGYFAGSAFPRRPNPFAKIGEKEYFVIANYQDLCDFAAYVYESKDNEKTNAILVSDIECNGSPWPIAIGARNGDDDIEYRGEFNGNGFAIKNLNITRGVAEYHTGLFGMVHTGCHIHDLKLLNVNVTSGGRAAGLIGRTWGDVKLENVLVTGNITLTANTANENISYAAGILAYAAAGTLDFENVGFVGNISGGYGNGGANAALVAHMTGGNFTNCYADATVGNIRGDNRMYYNTENNVTVTNSYMNVRPQQTIPMFEADYRVYQPGFTNVYDGSNPDAFHTVFVPGRPNETHLVRVYGIPDDWANPHIHYWNGEGFDSPWPGIELKKGDGYWFTYVENNQAERIMINDGTNNKESDKGGSPISFNTTSGDFDITFDGQGSLTVDEKPIVNNDADKGQIFVRNNFADKTFMVVLTNSRGEGRMLTPDSAEGEFSVFTIPADFNSTGLKYTVVTVNPTTANELISSLIPNPMPAKEGKCRIYVKKNVPNWDNLYIYLWGNDFSGNNVWARVEPLNGIEVKFNDTDYYCFDFNQEVNDYWGINFVNAPEYPCYEYQDAIVRFDSDMLVELTEVPTTTDEKDKKGKIKGGYFQPLFFKYVEGEKAPELKVGNTTYKAIPVTVDGQKYYCINFARVYDSCDGFVFPVGTGNTLQEPVRMSAKQPVNALWQSVGVDVPAQFYDDLSVDGNTYVYLDNRDINDLIQNQLGWKNEGGILTPAMTTEIPDIDASMLNGPVSSHDLRWYGTSATFYQPRKGQYAPDDEKNLKLDAPSYYIAADFAHEFNPEAKYNLDNEKSTIHEPILSFRYVWQVKDGKTFADKNTATRKGNLDYLSRYSRAVSARAGKDFQIRLSSLVPVDDKNNKISRTNFYYKKNDGTYSRVPRVDLEVYQLDAKGNAIAEKNGMFFFDAKTTSQGYRKYLDVENGFGNDNADGNAANSSYYGGDGNASFFRSIYCKGRDAAVGQYRVRLVAKDLDGQVITTANGEDKLYLGEYVVTFLPEEEASVVTEEELINATAESYLSRHTTAYLEQDEVAGPPAVVVDFDQFRVFEDREDSNRYFRTHEDESKAHKSYLWPLVWDRSTYSFGYGGYYHYDYNEYIVANHSSQVMYHTAADDHVNALDGSSGLYDRLWYDTNGKESGYFYYTNAASDPGVAANLRINNLCTGSTVVVSAWIAEMSYENEVANISFNFVAVDKQGNREIVHSFVSGYIDNRSYENQQDRYDAPHSQNRWEDESMKDHGKWMHVYYSFVPNLDIKTENLDHYELELENNCMSSMGADYAVDDIRAYIISPAITARQLAPVCDDDQKTIGIRLSSRFDKLLDSNGLIESTADNDVPEEEVQLKFMVLDKKKYDALSENQEYTVEKIVEESAISFDDKGTHNVESDIITVSFSTRFPAEPDYDENTYNKAMYYKSETSGVRYVRTNILPFDQDLKPGKEYYIVLSSNPEAGYADFSIHDQCAKYAVMTLQGSGVIKIDGIAYNSGDPIEVCAGQSPVVQVDLKMLENGKDVNTSKYNEYINAAPHYYDWFNGSVDEFMTTPEGDNSYYNLLATFRDTNKDATELPEAAENDVYAPLRDLIAKGRLVLHASSFVFPPLKADAGQDNVVVLTAMPILPDSLGNNKYQVCSQPNEIRLRVANNSPVMYDGFDGITYPQADVPMRLGYRQLKGISDLSAITANGQINVVDIPKGTKYLELPLRGITSYKGANSGATMVIGGNKNEDADPFVYLVETNDPRYIGLDKHPNAEAITNSLLPIGMMQNMNAVKDGDNNSVGIVFDRQMQFREGYYYRVRFSFDEKLDTEVGGYCQGQTVFTLKVVPEYLKWTGADSRNWNNDANWSRISSTELMGNVEGKENLLTDGKANDTTNAYAPLDFTKVIIPNLHDDKTTAGYPWMFTEEKASIATLNGDYDWSKTAETAETGVATENIQYDMTSLDKYSGKLACRPWYANTCEQIHFNHGAELVHQESFVFEKNYQKAWVDMEMTGDRWYTLGSPLQGVVAGDMYTLTATGQQDTELFKDITFNRDVNDRFKPAVYQRGWNKAETKTYFLGDKTHDSKSTAVALNWSRVYNDVDENYAPGTGFSIRTVTDGIPTPAEKVRFRLPKADDTYNYFDAGGNTEGADDTKVDRPGERHSLTDFSKGEFTTTVTVGTAGQYFLVSNPFIARMDMAKFFEANKNIEPAYWIMTDDRQDATFWDEKSGAFITTEPTGTEGVIAPMQGFFVQAKDPAKALTLKFTPDMIVTGAINNVELMSTSFYEPQLISVSALDGRGEVASRAVINIDPEASAAYDGAEDAALLLDRTLESRATVYTVASEQALAINSLNGIVETEVGVLAQDGVASTLVFEGVDNSEGLQLLDTTTGQFTDLYDGMSVDVIGSASGRFYITRPASGLAELSMAVVLKDRTVSIVAATEGIVARVYTPAGLSMGEWSVDDTSLKFDLEPGIFIVEAVADNQRVTRKFVVK